MGAPRGEDLFSLRVASGDPLPTAVVIWTRLATVPLDPAGGMNDRSVVVKWQVATDERFTNVVRAGAAPARPDYAHTVHVDVHGLEPAHDYFYRFRAGSAVSPIGRTRTAPPAGAPLSAMSLAVGSCQNYSRGYFGALARMSEEDLDAVLFLGDYIYEGDGNPAPRRHEPYRLVQTLEDYRIRYAQAKSDPALIAAHQAFPWIATLDDHEVRENWWDDPAEASVARRKIAFQAYWEHLPLRTSSMPHGDSMQIYRRFTFGDLATFNVLDTGQYRNAKTVACVPEDRNADGYCPDQLDPGPHDAGR